jgi:LysR family hydrogen peroxide-inducible transcriptional activator
LLKIIPFSKPVPARRIALAWRKNFARSRAVEALVKAVAQVKITGVNHLT